MPLEICFWPTWQTRLFPNQFSSSKFGASFRQLKGMLPNSRIVASSAPTPAPTSCNPPCVLDNDLGQGMCVARENLRHADNLLALFFACGI